MFFMLANLEESIFLARVLNSVGDSISTWINIAFLIRSFKGISEPSGRLPMSKAVFGSHQPARYRTLLKDLP